MSKNQKLNAFERAVEKVPAYKKFLKETGFKLPEDLKDLQIDTIPVMNKENYLKKYPHNELMLPDAVNKPLWYCSTSGSTGEPFYFPRDDDLALQASYMAEEFLKNSSHGLSRTLLLVGFGMGVWIGGTFTIRQFEIAAQRIKAPLSILPIGYNKTEMFKALKKLAPSYKQTIICGYPPFIKDLIDEAKFEDIDLKSLNIRLLMAAEAFTEGFRDYVCEHAGIKNPFLDTKNIYGTADVGAMAFETPVSILVRRLALEDPMLYKDVFGQIDKTPTLAQFNPNYIEFEEENGELYLSAANSVPLVHYAIGDHGGVRTYQEIDRLFNKYKVNLDKEITKAGISKTVNTNPFVFVYERTDLSATLHGINIYPEFIKDSLISMSLSPFFTEKFTMSTKHDVYHNQFLKINLELKRGVEPSEQLERKATTAIRKHLMVKSSEFAEISKSPKSSTLLHVALWPKGHKRYFQAGIKQKWVEKA